MRTLTVRGVRQALAHLEEVLEAAGEITITRRGRPVARVLPAGGRRPLPSHRDLRKSMVRVRTPSERLIREERDAR